ncbi:hypothetical protein KY285_023871 [Solanum tuberosum]|nr:hypothetical protein KY289_024202 [Solanum tuberosum]KAH0676070.1 hypothetical protein KY285_023871 [Solanum tuberosum]
MARKRQEMLNVDFDVEEDKYDMHHVLSILMDNIDDCISSCHHSTSSTTMTEEQLDFILLNLHHLSKYCDEQFFPSVAQYEILQNVCGNIRDFHGLIVNGYVEHGSVEYVLPQLQPMAEKVGLFLLNDQTDEDSRLFKLAHLLMKITPIELEEKQVESKSLTSDKMNVCFEEETNWIIRKLTSGPINLDVISIAGSVGQEYDEKKLVDKIFNQVIGSDAKLSENVNVVDKLQKQLYGKRYLIVFDDLWDTTTWDELTRPLAEVEKGSRIIFSTREKKVALHGKCHSDPLNVRLLTSEESWELFEERALGNESSPKELLDVRPKIVKGFLWWLI